MTLQTVILIILVLLLLGYIPMYPRTEPWPTPYRYAPPVALVIIIILIILLL